MTQLLNYCTSKVRYTWIRTTQNRFALNRGHSTNSPVPIHDLTYPLDYQSGLDRKMLNLRVFEIVQLKIIRCLYLNGIISKLKPLRSNFSNISLRVKKHIYSGTWLFKSLWTKLNRILFFQELHNQINSLKINTKNPSICETACNGKRK